MTVTGEKKLQDELQELKTVKRPQIIEAIAEARAHGDLKENAEYHAAREQQSFTEGRIKEIEAKLSNCQIIDISKIENKGKVIFGVTVDIINVDTDEVKTYTIVGEDEADIKENRIFAGSPIAKALIGKEVGEIISVDTPGGSVDYEIDDVRHEI